MSHRRAVSPIMRDAVVLMIMTLLAGWSLGDRDYLAAAFFLIAVLGGATRVYFATSSLFYVLSAEKHRECARIYREHRDWLIKWREGNFS